MSSDLALSVRGISKAYTITHAHERHSTLAEAILHRLRDPFRKAEKETFWALKDVSFDVMKGEVIGIIGRNGAGKSTLLKILSRITEPSSGEIDLHGRIASLLEVGTGFHPELTGRENVFLNGAILGMTKVEIRKQFDAIVEFSGIEKFIDTPVKRYSSGMYVRLAFAVAAHQRSEILIIDEVLAVGDTEFQAKCLGKIKNVAGQGRTVLFVSHNLVAVSTLTNRCVYLANGMVRFIGSTRDAIREYTGAGDDPSLIYLDKEPANCNDPRIRSVQIKTALPGNIHVNNAPMDIILHIYTPRPIEGACLSVQIFDSEQVNYAHMWTHDCQLPMCREAGSYLVKCHIPRFRLYMGRYFLRIFFSEPPGGKSFQVLDGICPFEVNMRDNHRLFQWWPKECAYVEDCRWEVQPVNGE